MVPRIFLNIKDSNIVGSSDYSANSPSVRPTDSTFTIITEATNGSITPEVTGIAPYFNTTRITYMPINGNYKLDSIFVNNVYIGKDSADGYTFNNIYGSQRIRVVYSIKKFSLTGGIGGSGVGKLSFVGSQLINIDTTYKFYV